jgi:phage terminase Nu1 subunit (DNA packaging protein)
VKGARLFDSRELLPVALGLTGDKLDPAQERAKLDATRRQVAELQLAERRRELIPRPAVVDTWTRIIVVVRGRLLALPVRLASECGHRGPAEIQATAKRLVYEALTELANSDGLPPGNEPRPAPVEVLDPSTPRKASKRTRAQTVRG